MMRQSRRIPSVILTASLGLLLPVSVFAQEQSDFIREAIKKLEPPEKASSRYAVDYLERVGAQSKQAELMQHHELRRADRNSWRQVRAALIQKHRDSVSMISALIEALKHESPEVRNGAAFALGSIGAASKKALSEFDDMLLDKILQVSLRDAAAFELGVSSADPKETEAMLKALEAQGALKDERPDPSKYPSFASGRITAELVIIERALIERLLIEVLEGGSATVHIAILAALSRIGPVSEEAEPLLISMLKAGSPEARKCAAIALGDRGTVSEKAMSALIAALNDGSGDVRITAADALVLISQKIPHNGTINMLLQLKEAYEAMQSRNELSNQAVKIRGIIDEFESSWWVRWRLWVLKHPNVRWALVPCLLPLCWLVMLWLRPQSLPSVSSFLGRHEWKISAKNVEVNVSLRSFSLISLFHFHKRVLDKWTLKYIKICRENFKKRLTVAERQNYIQAPAIVDGRRCESLSLAELQPFFDKRKATLMIAGAGGTGKTSLSCQMAAWAMSDKAEERLCKSHRMLPVLIEENIEPGDKNAFIRAVRGQLENLIEATKPIPEELVLRLLREGRLLVIVDSLSDLDEATRNMVNPSQPDFPIAALVVTSRFDDFRSPVKTTIRPLGAQSIQPRIK